jgi:hypothetical protein
MQGVDRKSLNNATIFSYMLLRALFDELDEATKRRVIERALTYSPPEPDQGLPIDHQMWEDARTSMRKLAAS